MLRNFEDIGLSEVNQWQKANTLHNSSYIRPSQYLRDWKSNAAFQGTGKRGLLFNEQRSSDLYCYWWRWWWCWVTSPRSARATPRLVLRVTPSGTWKIMWCEGQTHLGPTKAKCALIPLNSPCRPHYYSFTRWKEFGDGSGENCTM